MVPADKKAFDPVQLQAKLHALLQAHDVQLHAYVEQHLPSKLRKLIAVDDIVQDTYFRAYRNLDEFAEVAEAASCRWLMTIARNIILNYQRDSAARKRCIPGAVANDRAVQELLAHFALYSRTPSRSAMSHELAREVQRCIERLTDDYRRAIRLRFIEGLSLEQAAAQMGRTGPAVTMLCQRASKALRLELQSIAAHLISFP